MCRSADRHFCSCAPCAEAMRSGPAAVCLVAVSVGCGGVLVGDGTYTMHRTDGKTAHCVPSGDSNAKYKYSGIQMSRFRSYDQD